ncbi:hypothetical protein H6763_01535 [Candidatus Nomurabacteria bacterium]|uniref:Trigger factor n=1 Tax=Candidatus Dojkabacteria bacterium TaxID=2099670 RepID=A0A955I304_9BACT|nr:hypothetical protein [Candidatus Dojkabacteria bacterium]MCB9789887.1 hypothetical protein [Candidatus Nomurabacteria bacterium]MCB9803490.1 hypothetical protein [Candidatus Nomurabacteria bacterium]
MDDFYSREDDSSKKHEIILKMDLPADAFAKSYEQLLQTKSKDLNLKGFRKGKTPKEMIEPKMRDLVLAETFERIAPYYVNAAIIKEKLQPVAPPEYLDLGELKVGEGIKFTVKVTVMPDFDLADTKKIKVEQQKPDVKETEIDQTLETMFKNNATTHDPKKEEKPDDEWALRIAKLYQFDDVRSLADLRAKIKELIMQQKRSILDQNAASDAMREAVKVSKIEIPQAAIVFEAQQREEAFQRDLDAAKMSMRDFLKERDLRHEELKEMWLKDAKEALENDVVLRIYADKKDIVIEADELRSEIEAMKKAAEAQYRHDHEGHDHPMEFDESAYDDPQWQEQIKTYMRKQKAYRQFLQEVFGEDFFGNDEKNDQESKKATTKGSKVETTKSKEKKPETSDKAKKDVTKKKAK